MVLVQDVLLMNGGYSTNCIKVSRRVRQWYPLGPLLLMLGVEILDKIRQSTSCQGIKLPQSVEAKTSQLVDYPTPINRDVNALSFS